MNDYQVIIAGAGAAGLMAAISAGRAGAKNVLLLDASERPGTKILMSGGGRCNITNAEMDFRNFRGESVNGIKKVILQFPPDKVVDFFISAGVKTKVEEPWNKVFPVSDSASNVLNSLLAEVRKYDISFKYPVKLNSLSQVGSIWECETDKGSFSSETVILATGGFSYPHTGSDGSIWTVLRNMGVTLVQPRAALTPLKCSDHDLHALSGLTVWCRIKVRENGKEVFNHENSLLFTHDGLSGPGILNASEWFTDQKLRKVTELTIGFFPEENENEVREWLTDEIKNNPTIKLSKLLRTKLPDRLAAVLINRLDFTDISIGQLPREKRNKLIALLTDFKPDISGHSGFKKAEVTAGGVPFSEINLATMEVKQFPGLFLAGEIINVHGIIGGYNFQWAWSSGWLAGKSSLTKIKG
ncbi:MAG: aminoacetone oxidase family FAD-binding enzyme [Bacteroidetes bacterium]|nr:aminoacetone oxidase family FAD-binding enzyme [Bacteroidota bacterium]